MHTNVGSTFARPALGGLLVVLVGCAAGTGGPSSASRSSFDTATSRAVPGVASDAVLLGSDGASRVNMFSAGGAIVGAITGFTNPYGIAADPTGNIYVTAAGNNSTIAVYSSDGKTLLKTLTDTGEFPISEA
jgi:DNA-binding beta-propeller fold protein YncE